MKLFQNFSFWNSFLGFRGKTGLLPVFPGAYSKSNRVSEQAQRSNREAEEGTKYLSFPSSAFSPLWFIFLMFSISTHISMFSLINLPESVHNYLQYTEGRAAYTAAH
jgi:hypothetical protein